MREKREERDRIERINASAPPAHTIEGQLTRWKDKQREERGEEPLRVEPDEEPMGVADEDLDNAEDLVADERELAANAPAPEVLRPKHYKPGHRVDERKASRTTGELPWWTRAPRQGMTAAAESERQRMEQSKVAKHVKGDINEI